MTPHKIARTLLVLLNAFLAVTAFAGGVGLLTGGVAPGTELLRGSPFADYTIPGLALLLLVGGSALVATILLLRRHPLALVVAATSGAIIVVFEIVEVLVIGSEPGVARNLQLSYGLLGVLILVLAGAIWTTERRQSA